MQQPLSHNRLATATSPYLRMHAGNPVHWQPWDATTLEAARAADTPILLSIGYSACHWCHVMAHECFEDPAIAAAMNQSFVNIKLDREERPDIDHAYQLAYQALAGRGGGWPLTAFLDPQDLAPFYLGTYFPPTPGHGLPGFPEVLQRVRAFFDDHRDELRARARQLRAWVEQVGAGAPGAIADSAATDRAAFERMAARFDPEWGGNRGAPKFPRPAELEWLLDLRTADATAAATRTLANMATRGLQDHLGGGFFRYSVDANWTIPHFEKMLYDNAALLPVYARLATAAATEPAARTLAHATVQHLVDWLARDMTTSGGTFCSSLDADSEHQEGRFYLWTRDDIRIALDDADVQLAEAAYGLDQSPNFEGRAWHLLRATPVGTLAQRFRLAPDAIATRLAAIRRRMFAARARRVHPARDDKVLTAWNALVLAGLARAARMLDNARCAELAATGLAALRNATWIDGRLYANAAPPAARIPGFLDDHALLLEALLEALQLSFRAADLAWASALADALCERFADPDGGFWFSTTEHATPLARSRNWTDDTLPNGGAVAIRGLLRLGHLVGESRWIECSERALHAAAGALTQYPEACPTLLRALREYAHPRPQVVVRCAAAHIAEWRQALREGLRRAGLVPGSDAVDVFVIPVESGGLPGLLAERGPRGDAGAAYLCSGLACQAPVTTPAALAAAIAKQDGA